MSKISAKSDRFFLTYSNLFGVHSLWCLIKVLTYLLTYSTHYYSLWWLLSLAIG